jgi:hypothetical protein
MTFDNVNIIIAYPSLFRNSHYFADIEEIHTRFAVFSKVLQDWGTGDRPSICLRSVIDWV